MTHDEEQDDANDKDGDDAENHGDDNLIVLTASRCAERADSLLLARSQQSCSMIMSLQNLFSLKPQTPEAT